MVLAETCQPPGAAAHHDPPRNGNDLEQTGCSARRDGGFLWLTGPGQPPEQDAQTPSRAPEISSTWSLMEGTQFLLKTRISVKNEVNALSTVGKEARGQLIKDQILALKRGPGKKLTP